MWVRKSDQQIAGERQIASERRPMWLSFGAPAVLFVFCFFAGIATAIRGPKFPTAGVGITSWSEAFLRAAKFATTAAIVVYVLQIVLGRPVDSLFPGLKIDICNTCYRVKNRDRQSECECGGTFEDFDKWTWVDEDR